MEVGMIVFKVSNMRCGGCARSVTAALRGADPKVEIRVDLQRREVSVPDEADAERMSRALHEAGFPSERLAG